MRGWRLAALVVLALIVALGLEYVAIYRVQGRGVSFLLQALGFAVALGAPVLMLVSRSQRAQRGRGGAR